MAVSISYVAKARILGGPFLFLIFCLTEKCSNAANIAIVLVSFEVSLSYMDKEVKRVDEKNPTFNSDNIF